MKNKTQILLPVLSLLLTGFSAHAASFADKCPDIPACAKSVGELLGQKYIFDGDVKGKVQTSPNVDLTKENAELLFTSMLNLEGYSRVPLGEVGSFQIVRQRDARDQPIPTVSADQKHPPELPNNWDLYTMKYKASNPEIVEHLARTCRSFMPANSRIIPDEVAGMMLVTDSAMNLKKMYGILADTDRRPSAEVKKRWEEEGRARREEMVRHGHEEHGHDEDPGKIKPPMKTSSTN